MDDQAGKLARYQGPPWRKAYLAHFLDTAARRDAEGDAAGAAWCRARLAALLAEIDPAAFVPSPGTPEGDAEAEPAKAAPERPLDNLKSRWRRERVAHVGDVLSRHGGRLSALERKAYRDRLERIGRAAVKQGRTSASEEAQGDLSLLDLRRRMYQRILKAQGSALGFRSVKSFRGPEVSVGAEPSSAVIGPYNDRYNLDGLLELVGRGDPAWVEELLELYRGLEGMGSLAGYVAQLTKGK